MNASSEEFHIVFVIDVKGRHEKGAGEYITDHTIKSIQLAGLKLLTYFSTKATRSVLKWGVKYFNFCGKTEQIRKCGFKDFSGKTYEEFEAEVERLLHSERLKLDNRVKSPHKNKLKQMTAFMIDEDSIYNDINLIGDADDEKHPSMKIREALQQTALEFNWDRPLTVLGSPVRGKRLHHHSGGISLDSNKLGTIPGNHIFLFAPCPQSINDLCHFTECYRDDFQPHCNAFITRNLQRDLQLSRKINVHWVNIVDNPVQTQDFRGIDMVDKIFCGLGGGVLPIETIIQLKSSFDRLLLLASVSLKGTHDAAISQSNPKRSCFFLPFSSTLDYYLAKAKSCPDRVQLDLNKNYTLLCNMNGDSPNILCALSLHSMVKPDSPRQNVNVGNNRTKKSAARSSNEVDLNIQQHHSEDCSTMTIDTSDTVIGNAMPQTVQTTHPVYNTYQISGTIKTGALPLDSFDCDKVYCCTGRKFDSGKYLVTEETSDVFQTLLMELFKQRLNLVLEDCSPIAFPRKMILQPLTPVSATVTSIRPDRVLQLEKLLSLPSPDKTVQSEDLKNFVNKSVKHIQAGFGLGTGTYQPDPIKVNSTGSMPGLSDQDVFHCPTVEQWNQPESSLKVAGLVQEFRPSPSIKKIDRHLQKKLAKFYQRVDQPKTMSGQIKHGEIENTQKGDNEVAGAIESRKKQLERLASSIKTTRGKHLVDTIHHIKTSQRKSESDINSTSVDVEEMRQKKHEAKVKERRDRIKENIAKHDITEESSLFESLRANYSLCISGSISPVSCAQSLVNVIVHFSKSTHPGNYSDKSRGLLNEHFLKSYKSMRDNHMTAYGGDESMKIAEYQLQVLLRIELESALLDGEEEVEDEWLEEIANMLRKAAFSSDTTFLPQFLKEVVLENYVYVLPKTVGKIYEELMTEPPEEYAYLLSCENSDKDDSMNQHENSEVSLSVPMSLRSSSSIGSYSNEPWSNKSGRSRSLVSQSSFTDTNLKRQIMVPLVKKPKVEKAKTRDTKVVTRSSAKKRSARKKKIADPKVEVTKVKRNLFLGGDLEGFSVSGKTNRLERRHTMATIPSTGSRTPRKSSTPGKQTPRKTPRKTPCKSTTPKKMSPRHPRHSRKPRLRHRSGHMVKEHHILKTKMVSETPRHKQVGQALRRQERQRSQTVQEVAVVEESPEKEDNIENAEPNTSLPLNISQVVSEKHKIKGKPALARRASFYSESSRNLQKHRELARRIAGHQPVIPLQPQMKLKLKTPVRKRGDFLLTQLRKSSEKKTENVGDNIGVKKSTPVKSDPAETRIDAAVTPRRATKKALFRSPAKTPTRNQTSTPRGSGKKDTVHQTRGTPRKSPKKSRTPNSAKRKVFDKQITTPVKGPSLHEVQRSTSAKKSDMRDAEAPDKLSSPQRGTPVKDECDFEWLTSVGTTPKKADDNFGAIETSVPDTPSRNTRSRSEAEQCYMPRNNSDASKCFIQESKPEEINSSESEFSTKIAKTAEVICEDDSAIKGDVLNECHAVDRKQTSRSHQKRSPSTSKKSRKKTDSASGVEDDNDTTPMKGQLSIKTFLQHTPPSETVATSVSPFTPPPSRSQTTPDTFDKWHRRKSRYSLNSPATLKSRASAITKGSVSSPPSPFSTNIQAKSKKRGKPRKYSPSASQKISCDKDDIYLLDSNLTSSGEESIGTSAQVQNQNEDSSVSFHEYMAFLSPSHRKTRKAAQEGKMSDDESVIHFKVPEDQGFSLFDPESAIQYNINVAKQVLRPGEDFSPVTVHKKEILYDTETAVNDEEGSKTLKKDAIDSRRIRKSLSKSSFGSIEPRLHSTKRGLEKEYTSFELAGRHFPSTGGDMAGESSCDDSSKENKLLSRKRTWTSPGDRRLSKRRRTNTNSSPCYSENSLDNVSAESEDVFLSENVSFNPSSSSNSDLYITHPGNGKGKKSNFQLFGDAETGESPVHHRIHSLRKGLARSSSGNISHASSNDGFECDGDNITSNLSLQSLSGKLHEKARTDQMQSPQELKKSSPKYSPVSAMGLLGLINSPIINSEDMGMKTTVDRAGDGEKRPRSRRTLNMKSNLS